MNQFTAVNLLGVINCFKIVTVVRIQCQISWPIKIINGYSASSSFAQINNLPSLAMSTFFNCLNVRGVQTVYIFKG